MDNHRTIKLVGGPYDGEEFTGQVDPGIGEPVEFTLEFDVKDNPNWIPCAGDMSFRLMAVYRVNSEGIWAFFCVRKVGAFVSVEPASGAD